MTRHARMALIPVALATLALVVAVPVSAAGPAPGFIGFDGDAVGVPDEPFTSYDNPTVHFEGTISTLFVGSFPGISDDNMLWGSKFPPENFVVMRFDVPLTRLSIPFGGGYSGVPSPPPLRAVMRVYRGAQLVEKRSALVDHDGLINQKLTYRGGRITRATFMYVNLDGTANFDNAELIDDIEFTHACTMRGTNGANVLTGNAKANGICGLDGRDRLYGRGGNDVLNGGKGRDRIEGGAGDDIMVGGPGDDTLRARDGRAYDYVYGGPGADTCIADHDDFVSSCEHLSLG